MSAKKTAAVAVQERPETLANMLEAQSQVHALIAANDGELTPTLETFLEEAGLAVGAKVDRYRFAEDALEAQEEYLKQVAAPILRAAKVLANERERLRERLKKTMLDDGSFALDGATYGYTLSRGKPKLEIDMAALDVDYKIEERTYVADRPMIEREIAGGAQIEGVRQVEVYSLRKRVAKGAK